MIMLYNINYNSTCLHISLLREKNCRSRWLQSYKLKNINYTYCQLESAPPTAEPQPCTYVPYSSLYTY